MSDPVSAASAAVDTSVDNSEVNESSTVEQVTEEATGKPAAAKPEVKKPEPPKPKQEPAKKWKLKVDKGEEEYSEEELIKLAQLGRASDKRFQEAAKIRKNAEDFIAKLKTDPASVLENPAIGLKAREWAEQYLLKQLEAEEMSPEQRRIQELEAKIAEQAEKDRLAEEQKKQEADEKLRSTFVEEYNNSFKEALANAGLPRTARTVAAMAKHMQRAIQHGIDRKPHEVVELVRQDYIRDINDLFGQSDGDSMLQILGEGLANKIRVADLKRLKEGKFKKVTPAPEPTETPAEQPKHPVTKKFMNIHEWREFQANRFKGE